MESNNDSLIFMAKVSNIREQLRMLREQGIINDGAYMDFYFLTSTAQTFDQLDQLTDDLAEICQSGWQ
jgi:ribosomal protein L19E